MTNTELHQTTLSVMNTLGLKPDPWQVDVVTGEHQRLLLNCSRQSGKTTVVAIMGLIEAMLRPMTRVFLVSRSMRQSREMFRLMVRYHQTLHSLSLKRQTAEELEFQNDSRIVSVPCREDTIRGFAAIDLLIIDEAARVPDTLYRAVRPMLAVSKGRLIALSTPYGKRGWFYDGWAHGGDDWARIEVPADKCPRITAEFLDQERRALGESWYRQEYCCSFESVEGIVYPDFSRCVVPALPADLAAADATWNMESRDRETYGDSIRRVGGIDFGFRNPFAALWGLVDRDGVLWLTGEHYARQQPLSYHAERLPRNCFWYADPSGASEISELRRANFTVKRGFNEIRLGIAAVSARLADGSLRVLKDRCPNLISEAGMYRWGESEDGNAEVPVDEHNHALAALRYLIGALDGHSLATRRKKPIPAAEVPVKTREELAREREERRYREWLDSDEPGFFSTIGL